MSSLAGTRALVRLALRRDRIVLPLWILIFAATAAFSAAATLKLYPTATSLGRAANDLNNTPSLVALYGRVYDPRSLGAVAIWKMGGTGAIGVALLAIVMVIRHTRAEEEPGRLELIGATAVGRMAPLTAALLVATGANIVLGLLSALGLIRAGLPADGSFAFGLAWAGVGIAFAAVAATTAQLSSSSRRATGVAVGVLGAVYLLRAIGDTAPSTGPRWLSWLSPIGWGQQFRPFAGDRWWVVLLTLAFGAVTVAGAYALAARRDARAGLLPDRPGRAIAAASLRSPLALAWRLQRGALLGWAAGFVILGLVFGNVASSVGNMLSTQQSRDMISRLGGQGSLTDAFLAAVLGLVGVIASAYGVQAAMRLRSEETELRAEPLLATAVSRLAWAASHIVVALAGTTALLVAAGLGAGLAYSAHTGDPGQIGRLLAAALVQLPAVWLVTGIAVAFFGLAPRWTVGGWIALFGFLLLGELGPVLQLSHWLLDFSPFAHVPRMPGGTLAAAPIAWLLAVAALLMAGGLTGFRRRGLGIE